MINVKGFNKPHFIAELGLSPVMSVRPDKPREGSPVTCKLKASYTIKGYSWLFTIGRTYGQTPALAVPWRFDYRTQPDFA